MKRNPVNESYFEVVNTQEKAYWLGFIAADGCIEPINGSYRLVLNIKASDVEILNKLAQSLESGQQILIKEKAARRIGDNVTYTATLRIGSKKLCTDIINLGITTRKSLTLEFPYLEEPLIRHFIRGYFDGNGSICKRSNANTYKATIASASWNFIDSLSKVLHNNNVVHSVYRDKTVYQISITNKPGLLMLYKFMYLDSSMYLDRKKEKFTECIFKINPIECPPGEQSP